MLSELTPKQEAFCVAYIKSGNASEAYRLAYDAANMSESSVNVEASNLIRNPKLAPRLAELRASVAESSNVTLRSHLADLLWLREMAAKDGKYGAAVQAEMARGKVIGLYIERFLGKFVFPGQEDDKKLDLSTLTLDEKRVMLAMLEKTGATGQLLQ